MVCFCNPSYLTFYTSNYFTVTVLREISSSRGDEYEDDCFLGCCALRAIGLIMEAVSVSETSGSFIQTTRRNVPEDSCPHAKLQVVTQSLTARKLPV
jgi:hypothetical protein